jgi:hypothetical protein
MSALSEENCREESSLLDRIKNAGAWRTAARRDTVGLTV